MKRIICRLVGHRLGRVIQSECGQLEMLACHRCRQRFAMYRPTKWFDKWDESDTAMMRMLGVKDLPSRTAVTT